MISTFSRRSSLRRSAIALAAALALAAVVAIVHAAIPDASGVIHGCYKSTAGDLRVVDDPATCKNNETPIAWNHTGVQGPKGPQGPQGPQGSQGPQGPAGPSGTSHAYFFEDAHDSPISGEHAFQPTSLAGLPTGHYVVTAQVDVVFEGCTLCSGNGQLYCYFQAGDQIAGNGITISALDENLRYPMSAAITVNESANGTVAVICVPWNQRDMRAAFANIVGTRVDALN